MAQSWFARRIQRAAWNPTSFQDRLDRFGTPPLSSEPGTSRLHDRIGG